MLDKRAAVGKRPNNLQGGDRLKLEKEGRPRAVVQSVTRANEANMLGATERELRTKGRPESMFNSTVLPPGQGLDWVGQKK